MLGHRCPDQARPKYVFTAIFFKPERYIVEDGKYYATLNLRVLLAEAGQDHKMKLKDLTNRYSTRQPSD